MFAERRQWLSLSNVRHQEAEAAEDDQEEGGEDEEKKANLRPVIDPETSIRYLKSKGVRKKHTFSSSPVFPLLYHEQIRPSCCFFKPLHPECAEISTSVNMDYLQVMLQKHLHTNL